MLQQEADFERVLHKLDRGRAPVRWGVWLPATAGLTAALAAAFMLLMNDPIDGELSARGGQAQAPALQVLCVEHGAAGHCPRGGRLAFKAEPAGYRYLALFARRSDGLVIWYFPSADGRSAPIAERAGDLLRHGVKLGDDQPPGRYEITGVFSNAPLTRDEIKRDLGAELQGGGSPLRIVRQSFVVEPRP